MILRVSAPFASALDGETRHRLFLPDARGRQDTPRLLLMQARAQPRENVAEHTFRRNGKSV